MTLRRIFAKFFRRSNDRDMSDEFESHLALHIDDNLRAGMTAEEARRNALLKFGGLEATKEAYRETSGIVILEQTAQDLRYAVRGFLRAPAFTLTAITTLAIGIGASVAVFSAIDPLLFRPLPYPNGERLVSFGYFGLVETDEFAVVSSYLDWRKQPGAFQSVTSIRPPSDCDLMLGEAPKQVRCARVEANFLRTLGLRVALGRDFTTDDDQEAAPQVALISHRLWLADTQLLNGEITINSGTYRVIGVLPPQFELPQSGDVDILQTARFRLDVPRAANASAPLRTFGRLRDGATIEQARAQMEPVMRASAELDVPKSLQSEIGYVFQSLRERRIHQVKTASWMLFAAVLGLLLLACANVANLLLARSAARTREISLRIAVGASRWRLIRQTLSESLLLGFAACATGCAVGWMLLKLFANLAPLGFNEANLNRRALAFALLASLTSTLLFGLLPALRTAPDKTRFRKFLVAAQVALSLILLTGASLFLRSLERIQDQALGFKPEQLLTASFTLRQQRYNTPASQVAFAIDLENRLRNISETFSISDTIPPAGGASGRPYSNIVVEGRSPLAANGGMVLYRSVTPGYFRTMQIPVLAGRSFSDEDRSAAEDPLILGVSLARKMFGSESPLGHRLAISSDGKWHTVIGVVADVHNSGLDQPLIPEYYRLRMNDGRQVGRATIALFRTSMPIATFRTFIEREIASIDPTLPVKIESMETRVLDLQDRPRFLAFLVAAFALCGLLLSMTGLYGVLSFLVAQRRREIGVRLAVGASASHVASIFFKQALGWTAMGVAAGLAGSFMLARNVSSLLFEVAPYDPASLLLAAAVLILSALGATLLPARRATKIDPIIALRPE